ncbi:primase-helicase zinc-binding domain-containing protein [Acinetobacter haemolyticus]|uniref:primase-helicase zinc-binding domain-containing protein n=1 Tax=Acinetobacter haemolyticus TaxID=29430 RepID=UPI0021CDCFF3|nr:primase-helicase zinc-binding domain-containing protein [Acinetobacter haemolyticus]MCU4378867.1 DNA primase [Acinetobacter haemolyticus]
MAKKKIQAEDIKRAAEGKWMDLIFPRFGIDVQWKKKTPCPACGGRDRFRFDDKNGNGDYFCQHCQGGDGLDLIGKCTHLSFPEVVKEVGAILGLDDSSKITDADREKWRKEREYREKEQRELEQKMRENIARKAESTFRNAYLGDFSLYLKNKQIDKDQKIKITHDGNLLIPAYDEHGKMWNVQTITPDGQKFFITDAGGRTGGCFFMIGEVQPDLYDAHIICIAEGYATGMSIHMATGHPVALSFVANNLPKVGAVLRQKYPNAVFVYCADDDSAKQDTGLKYAQEAQTITGGIIVLPDFTQIKESVA